MLDGLDKGMLLLMKKRLTQAWDTVYAGYGLLKLLSPPPVCEKSKFSYL